MQVLLSKPYRHTTFSLFHKKIKPEYCINTPEKIIVTKTFLGMHMKHLHHNESRPLSNSYIGSICILICLIRINKVSKGYALFFIPTGFILRESKVLHCICTQVWVNGLMDDDQGPYLLLWDKGKLEIAFSSF